jgi:hypothetical protein
MQFPIKEKDVVVGGYYVAKISNKLARIRILLITMSRNGVAKAWRAVNLETGQSVNIKSARKLKLSLDAKFHPDATKLFASYYVGEYQLKQSSTTPAKSPKATRKSSSRTKRT